MVASSKIVTSSGVIFFTLFILSAHSTVAATLGPGCREATAEDKAAMKARGIPESFQVCPADDQLLGIGKDFDAWYARIKSEERCRSNKCTLSCRTRNTGAQRCGPTAKRWGAIGCHPHNQTAIFPTVPHGFAAHIELLRRYCGESGRCTIGAAIARWAPANVHNNSTRSYIAFVSRVAGVPANQVYDPNDIDLMARLATAMSCYEAGSLPYSAADLKAGLIMAAGGKRVPTPSNVGELLQESLLGGYATNPSDSPNSSPGSGLYPKGSVENGKYKPQTSSSGNTDSSASDSKEVKPPPPLPESPKGTPPTTYIRPALTVVVLPEATTVAQGARVAWASVGMDQKKTCIVTDWVGRRVGTGYTGTFTLLFTPEDAGQTRDVTVTCTPENPKLPEMNKSVSILVAQ